MKQKGNKETIKRCETCPYWKDKSENGYGTCKCKDSKIYGVRTISFHVCENDKEKLTLSEKDREAVSALIHLRQEIRTNEKWKRMANGKWRKEV